MTTKTKRISSLILMGIPCFVLIMGSAMKLAGAEPKEVVDFLTEAGFGGCMEVIGLSGLIIAALLIYPKTRKIGFLLASCYFAGALSLELSGGMPPVSAAFLALLWTGMFLTHREVFLPEGEKTN